MPYIPVYDVKDKVVSSKQDLQKLLFDAFDAVESTDYEEFTVSFTIHGFAGHKPRHQG